MSDIGEIDEAHSNEEAAKLIDNIYYDFIIMDVMSDEKTSFSLLKKIRKDYTMPVIILSANDDVDTKIKFFKIGADDYILKPFAKDEFIARVNVLLRRTNANHDATQYKFKNMLVNFSNKMLVINGNYIHLNRKTYDILELLVRNKGLILSKQQIFDKIWGYYSKTGTSVIEINIFRLRKTLSKYGLDKHLVTIKSTGYMWTENL